jgi:hypothetical protein
MREEAPRERQDRRAYISKRIHDGRPGFIDIPGKRGGAKDLTLARTEAKTWGKTSFRDSKAFAIRAAGTAAKNLRDSLRHRRLL